MYGLQRLLRIMSPILKAPCAPAVRAFFRCLFLRQMAFAVRNYLSHVVNIFLIVAIGILVRVLLEDLDDLQPTVLSRPQCNLSVSVLLPDLSHCALIAKAVQRGCKSMKSRAKGRSPGLRQHETDSPFVTDGLARDVVFAPASSR